MSETLVAVTVTGPSVTQLRALCMELLENHLIASANILSPVQSLYWWAGQITESVEAVAIIHTLKKNLPHALAVTRQLHPYETPQFVSFDALASADYLEWARQFANRETDPGTSSGPQTWNDKDG